MPVQQHMLVRKQCLQQLDVTQCCAQMGLI